MRMAHIRRITKHAAAAFLIIAAAIIAAIFATAPPPTPHSISGYIFESDGVTQAPAGTNYSINDTSSGDYVKGATSINVPDLSGAYFESINASDGDTVIIMAWNTSHYGQTATALLGDMDSVNVTMNRTRAPETNASIISPANGTTVNMSFYFNATAKTGMIIGSGNSCNATIGFNDTSMLTLAQTETALHQLGNIALGSFANTTWNVSPIKSGEARISVESACSNTNTTFEGLYYSTINVTIQDITLPNVTSLSPANNSWSKNNITFVYNATDLSGIKNCSIYLDFQLNQTNTTVQSGLFQNFTVSNMSEGNHTWLIGCFDNSTTTNPANSTAFTVNVDKTPPKITLITPIDNNISANNTAVFNYNVTENFVLTNCSLVINSAVNQTNTSLVLQNTTQNFTKTFAMGSYNWTVNCTDLAENTGTTEARNINITDPDLAISSPDITLSTYSPVEGQTVTINVTIRNIGDENATNFTVQLFENPPSTGAPQIGNNFALNLSANSNTSINVSWTAKPGLYNITALLDAPIATGGFVNEGNESNNVANQTVLIPLWHFYYGTITSDILLATASNITVFKWSGASNLSQNLYAADSDSQINWTGLQAIGVNSTGNRSMNDFEEADLALNSTNHTDSLNNTFTANSLPRLLENFTTYGRAIYNVSVANSTNNSNFATGILWDTSDLASGEYNGSQDLVFVTKVRVKSQGAYGLYDYEMRVPANLRRYLVVNNQDTVTFYTEIS